MKDMRRIEVGETYPTRDKGNIRCVAKLKTHSPYNMVCIGEDDGCEWVGRYTELGSYEYEHTTKFDVAWPPEMEVGMTYTTLHGDRVECIGHLNYPFHPIVCIIRNAPNGDGSNHYDTVMRYTYEGVAWQLPHQNNIKW